MGGGLGIIPKKKNILVLPLSAHCRGNTDLFLHCKDVAPARDEFGLLVIRSKIYLVYKPVNDPHILHL